MIRFITLFSTDSLQASHHILTVITHPTYWQNHAIVHKETRNIICVLLVKLHHSSQLKISVTNAKNRVTIRAIFPGCVLARISILPKISRIWLCLRVQTDRVWHRFLMFSNASRGTLNQSNIEILARTRPGKMARMVTLLKSCKVILFS